MGKYGRGPQLYQYSTDRDPPLLSLQIFICLYIFLEGGKGVKERRLQNDHIPPKCLVSYVKNDYTVNVASFTARSKKDNSRYSAERHILPRPLSVKEPILLLILFVYFICDVFTIIAKK